MGAKYSAGPYPKSFKNSFLKDIDLIFVRSRIIHFEKIKKGRRSNYNDMFITQSEVQHLLNLTPRQNYELFRLFDHENLRRLPTLDLWGALTLAASDGAFEKITFLFKLMDRINSSYLSVHDLLMILKCATRGLSRLKGIQMPPDAALLKVIEQATTAKSTELNERGEISLSNLRAFMLANDICRVYFSNLSTQAEAVDNSRLVKQRSDLLKEIAEIEAEMRLVKFEDKCAKEDAAAYARERGGDVDLVRISEAQLAKLGTYDSSNQDIDGDVHLTDLAAASSRAKLASKGARLPTEAQRLRRLMRATANGEKLDNMVIDAVAFSDARRCKPPDDAGQFNNVYEEAFLYKWSTFQQDDDQLSKLDIDYVEDLFEASGVVLADVDAQLCLDSLPANTLGRHCHTDALVWYRDFIRWGGVTDVPLCREVARHVSSFFNGMRDNFNLAISTMKKQKVIIETWRRRKLLESQKEMDRKRRIAKRGKKMVERLDLRDAAVDDDDAAATEAERSFESAGKAGDDEEEGDDITTISSAAADEPRPHTPSVNAVSSAQAASAMLGEIQGSARLAAWQRQQVLFPAAKIDILACFNMPTHAELKAQLEKEAAEAEAKQGKVYISAGQRIIEAAKRELQLEEMMKPQWKMGFSFDFSVMPLTELRSTRPPFFKGDEKEITNIWKLQPADLLEHYKYINGDIMGAPEAMYLTVTWLAVEINPRATSFEAECLSIALKNFFTSIPYEERVHVYEDVRGDIFTLSESSLMTHKGLWKDMQANGHTTCRVALIALLHKKDLFRITEDSLPPGILLTRAIREFKIELNLAHSFQELYEAALKAENFEGKLFGPQEDELGEEGMNPLRFAKWCKKRQGAAKAAIERAREMETEELKRHCQDRGLSTFGTKGALIDRVKKAFQRQIGIIGFGELSAYGDSICKQIFQKFKSVESLGEGLTLWGMNDLLFSTGSDTFFDSKEYKFMVDDQELLVDREHNLCSEGLTAYYEQHGQLGEDARTLSIGSLDEIMKGEFTATLKFDGEAFASMFTLLEGHTTAQTMLKNVFRLLGTTQSFTSESNNKKASEVLENCIKYINLCGGLGDTPMQSQLMAFLTGLVDAVRTPGWFPGKLHGLLESLADGDDGFLRSMRIFLLDEFATYDEFGSVFAELQTNWQRILDSGAGTSAFESLDETNFGDDDETGLPTSPSDGAATVVTSTTASSTQKSEEGAGEEEGDEEVDEKAAEAAREEARQDEIKKWALRLETFIKNGLPDLVESQGASKAHFDDLLDKVERLNDILASDEIHLSRIERENAREVKQKLEIDAAEMRKKIEESKVSCAAHACALYDAFRLYGKGLVTVGQGTREACGHMHTRGVDFASFMPQAMGENCLPRRVKEDKLRRAAQRKNAALAALERERLRRNVDPLEKERILREKAEKMQKQRDDEENVQFGKAFDVLCKFREERKTQQEIISMTNLWEELSVLKTSRYPQTFKAIVAQNNFACVCLEFLDVNHARIIDAMYSMEACVSSIMTILGQQCVQYVQNHPDEFVQKVENVQHTGISNGSGDEEGLLGSGGEGGDLLISTVGVDERSIISNMTGVTGGAEATLWPLDGAGTAVVTQALVSSSSFVAGGVPAQALEQGAKQEESESRSRTESQMSITSGDHQLSLLSSRDQSQVGSDSHSHTHTHNLDNSHSHVSRDGVSAMTTTGGDSSLLGSDVTAVAFQSSLQNAFPHIVKGIPHTLLAPSLIMLQNYISSLRKADNVYQLNKSIRILEAIDSLFHALKEKEQDRAMKGACRAVESVPVLSFGDVRENLLLSLADVERARRERAAVEAAKIAAAEREAALAAMSLASEDDLTSQHNDTVDAESFEEIEMSAKEAERKARQLKREMQRQADKLLRAKVSRQRNKLYSMIRTDEISKIFLAKSQANVFTSENVKWGDRPSTAVTEEDFLATPRSNKSGGGPSSRRDSTKSGSSSGNGGKVPKDSKKSGSSEGEYGTTISPSSRANNSRDEKDWHADDVSEMGDTYGGGGEGHLVTIASRGIGHMGNLVSGPFGEAMGGDREGVGADSVTSVSHATALGSSSSASSSSTPGGSKDRRLEQAAAEKSKKATMIEWMAQQLAKLK